MKRLRAIGIEAGYGRDVVLRDITLDLATGTVTVLIGSNGAGKSTLLNVLAGDLPPRQGRVELDGADIATLRAADLAELRAVLPQGSPLSFPYTVYEIVRLGLRDQSDPAETDRAVHDVLTQADLEGYGARRFQQLSGGEQQRVHIARVLAQLRPVGGKVPVALFLDEPTTSLDLKHQYKAMEIARGFARAGGTVVAVLHDLNLASAHADELAILADGRLLAKGSPREVLTSDILRRTFDATPRLNTDERDIPFILPPISGVSE